MSAVGFEDRMSPPNRYPYFSNSSDVTSSRGNGTGECLHGNNGNADGRTFWKFAFASSSARIAAASSTAAAAAKAAGAGAPPGPSVPSSVLVFDNESLVAVVVDEDVVVVVVVAGCD